MASFNRRQFLKSGVISAAAVTAAAAETTQPKRGFHPASEAGRGIKLGCSTALWRKGGSASLAEALAGVAHAGYEWVEIDANDLWEYRENPGEFKKLLEQHGLGLITVSLSGDFADREQRLKNISRAVLTARALETLGSGILVLEGMPGSIGQEPGRFHAHSANLAEVGALVYEETGLHCGYRFREGDAAAVRKIIATSDSRYVKFCFDTQYLAQLGIDPVPMIKTYGSRVIHIHLRDGIQNGESWQDVPVGTGKINANAVLGALCESRYNGWISVQQDRARKSPAADASESLRNLKPQLEAAVRRSPPVVAEAEPSQEGHRHPPALRRDLLQDLVLIGATLTSQPAALLRPAALTTADTANPMQQINHDMHDHRGRPVTPLPPQDPFFEPFFFSKEEYRDVSALAEAIIPATNTPGALEARADEYADLMIWLEQESHAQTKDQVARFREKCSDKYGKPFAELNPAQKTEYLTELIGKVSEKDRPAAQFFGKIRGLTVRAYYASPQGLIEELGYKGNTYVSEFKGCTHPEHHQA